MAKPIRATPKLTADETTRLLRNMILSERRGITKADRKLVKEINELQFEIAY